MTTFEKLATILKKHARGPLLELRSDVVNARAKNPKAQLHIYGTKEVVILNRPAQKTYVVGIIQQKHFVGFYSMPVYSHANLLKPLSSELKKLLKGKSCFHITDAALTPTVLAEIDAHIEEGIKQYVKEGWI